MAVAKLDVTGPRAVYQHQLQCDVLVWGFWYGKSRVFQTGELVVDEFALALGVSAYPKRSELQSYLDETRATRSRPSRNPCAWLSSLD